MNLFKTHWKEAQAQRDYPHHLRNIILIEAEEFVDKVTNAMKKSLVISYLMLLINTGTQLKFSAVTRQSLSVITFLPMES